jgi:hypothetical protein
MSQLVCPTCRSAHRAGARFCNQCGRPLHGEIAQAASSVIAPPASRSHRPSGAFAFAGGGCLLVLGLIVVAALFVAMQSRRVVSVPNIPVVAPTSRDVPIIVPTSADAPVRRPTPQPEVRNTFPPELVGQWAYSDENGSWLYSFNADGSYQRVFEAQMVSMGCAVTIKRYEEGFAAVDDSNLVLQIGAGQKSTTDSCDESRNALRDLTGTTETLTLQADFEGDRVTYLYVDKLPLRPN